MPALTTTYLDKKFKEQDEHLTTRITGAILAVVEQRFDEQSRRMDRIEAALASLTESVDRVIKKFMDHDQELLILRKQLHDMEERVSHLELKIKPS